MRLLYAPSARRMIPYPPVGVALLAGEIRESCQRTATVVDLEMSVWNEHRARSGVLLYEKGLDSSRVLTGDLDAEVQAYQKLLVEHSGIVPGEDVGISVMGFEQLASALLLCKAALERGARVIMGGQFWSERSARQVLSTFADERLTITVGDGWIAIRNWLLHPEGIPTNSWVWREGTLQSGPVNKGAATPPVPSYDSVDWELYRRYCSAILDDGRQIRRAHLYVWDKLCPFKCNFCRVSSGSKAKLNPPETLVTSLRDLLGQHVQQFNFMTNELNPSLRYMRDVVGELRPLLSSNPDVGWFTYLRPDSMERDDLRSLREIGCRMVRYGVETGSQTLSDRMQKDYTIPTVAKVLRLAAEADILNHVNFLVGYPGETDDDLQKSIDFVVDNHAAIHSVRINPFYLPPGTRLANEPQMFGIRLTEFRRGYWDFEMIDGSRPMADTIKARIEKLSDTIMRYGIGFAGVLPFETLNTLTQYPSRDEGIAELRRQRPYLWENASPDWLKSKLGGYTMHSDWSETILKRGRNYNMEICND